LLRIASRRQTRGMCAAAACVHLLDKANSFRCIARTTLSSGRVSTETRTQERVRTHTLIVRMLQPAPVGTSRKKTPAERHPQAHRGAHRNTEKHTQSAHAQTPTHTNSKTHGRTGAGAHKHTHAQEQAQKCAACQLPRPCGKSSGRKNQRTRTTGMMSSLPLPLAPRFPDRMATTRATKGFPSGATSVAASPPHTRHPSSFLKAPT
jgi:hypothetical protein